MSKEQTRQQRSQLALSQCLPASKGLVKQTGNSLKSSIRTVAAVRTLTSIQFRTVMFEWDCAASLPPHLGRFASHLRCGLEIFPNSSTHNRKRSKCAFNLSLFLSIDERSLAFRPTPTRSTPRTSISSGVISCSTTVVVVASI